MTRRSGCALASTRLSARWGELVSRINSLGDENCCAGFEESGMKVRLLMVMAIAVLLLVPQTASAQEVGSQPAAGVSGRAQMQKNANESAQATTDMSLGDTGQSTGAGGQPVQNVSYGGVAGGQSQTGDRESQRCSTGSQCKIYFGQ
jgi:hypothetical protein